MTVLSAIFQGILQGMTEFLPVSSSGHLSLYQYFTGISGSDAFGFSIMLHAGTLVAVCICFYKDILMLIYEFICLMRNIFTRKWPRRLPPARRTAIMLILSTLPLLLVLPLKDTIEKFSTDNDITVEGFCFLVTSLLLFFASSNSKGTRDGNNIMPRDALIIGSTQIFATMSGISRSGLTISTGLLCGLKKDYVVSYSFIMGIPAVVGAIILELKNAITDNSVPLHIILIGFIIAIIFGVLSIRLVQWLIRGDKFRLFAFYTLGLGVVVLTIGFIDQFTGHAVQNFFIGMVNK